MQRGQVGGVAVKGMGDLLPRLHDHSHLAYKPVDNCEYLCITCEKTKLKWFAWINFHERLLTERGEII